MKGAAWLRWILPALLLFLLVLGWLGLAVPRPVNGVRVFGGPKLGDGHVSLRLEAWQDNGFTTLPVTDAALDVSILRGTPPGSEVAALDAPAPSVEVLARWSGSTDDQGMAWVEVDLSPPSLEAAPLGIEVLSATQRTRLALSPAPGASWPSVERFAELPGTASGALRLRVLPAFTAFAVPFAQRVDVRVMRDGEPVLAHVRAELEGRGRIERIVSGVAPGVPELGARFEVEPGEHNVALRLEATAVGEPLLGTWYGRLPIVPGAFSIRRVDERTLRVTSPVRAPRAYLAVVDEAGRRFGAPLSLTDDGRGGGVLDVPLPFALGTAPLWAVASSEPRLDSDAALGWPISDAWAGPAPVRRVPELLLADSLAAERTRERSRQVAMQRALFLAALVSGALIASWFAYAVRGAQRRLVDSLSQELPRASLVESQGPRLVLFVLLLISSFVLLGIWLWIYWRPQ